MFTGLYSFCLVITEDHLWGLRETSCYIHANICIQQLLSVVKFLLFSSKSLL